MEKKDLITLLDRIFIPLNFKRKGNNWVCNETVLTKIVNLQKSSYGNFFYINYGYIINALELKTTMHISSGLGSFDEKENERIIDLHNLENNIVPEERLSNLKRFIEKKIVEEFRHINSEEDLLSELKKQPHLNNVPLVVKRHFNFEIK